MLGGIVQVFPATGRVPAQLGAVLKINGDGSGDCAEVFSHSKGRREAKG